MMPFPVIAVLVAVLVMVLGAVALRLPKATAERDDLRDRYRHVTDAELERDRILAKIADEREAHVTAMRRDRSLADQELAMVRDEVAAGKSESQRLRDAIAALHADFAKLDEEATLQSFGFYKPHYTFSESQKCADELDRIRAAQRKMLQDKTAATCAIEWQVNGSKAEGRKQTNQTLRLMLRAFNGESDAAIAKVNYRNVHVMEARIRKAHELIS